MNSTTSMSSVQVVSLVTAILGGLLGSVALAVSLLTYLRDKPKLKVLLQWDMREIQRGTTRGLIRVTNVGRRPVHLSIVALVLPPKYKHDHLVMTESIQGRRLEVGAKTEGFIVNYDGLAEYKKDWDKIRAVAEDSTGKKYYSELPTKKPSWAN
jgi:hypothetical protein